MRWWQRLWRRGRMEELLDKEVRFHLEQHAADLMARGYDSGEARRQARLALGGPEQVKEGCRDARGTRWLEDFWQDFRYALRSLRQHRGFAGVGLLTLALGTGATTVMFTVINSVLLKPLPYPDAARLVNIQEQTEKANQWGNLWAFTYPNYLDCKHEVQSLELAIWRYGGGTVSKPGDPEYLDGREISAELFPMLGVRLEAGRTFLPEEDVPGAAPVAIISHSLWQRRFGGSPQAIGAPLVFEAKSYSVIGIAPPDFRLAGDADVFIPVGQNQASYMRDRTAHFGFQVWARLRPHATLRQAQAELSLVGRRLAQEYPKSNAGRSFIGEPLRADVGDVKSTLWLLLGAVSLVLLIACVNIASLLLARAVSRERESAMRMALGASRGRLARQCLTESSVLGLAGGLLGMALATLGIRPFIMLWPGSLPRAEEVHMDARVLLFTIGISLASGLLFGLAPALRAPGRELERALHAGARSVTRGSRRLHGAFVIAEIALAVILLVSAGMLGRTMVHLSALDPGVNIHNILTARMALSPETLASPARIRAAWQEVLDSARRVPGVDSITMVDTVPLREGSNQIGYRTTPGAPPEDQQPLTLASSVTPEYLKVMGIPLRQGRFLSDQDQLGKEGVAVIDEVMARQAFGGRQAVGEHLWIGLGSDPVRVVGVVGHVRYWGAAADDQARVRAQLYYPFAQTPDYLLRRWSELMSVAVRTRTPPLNAVEALRREVRGATGDQVLYEVRTMEQLASDSLARQRFLLLLFGIFAGLALVLACVGIYGVQAYLTSRRVPEIGVRMALGASARSVQWMVLGESLGMIGGGLGVGTCGAIATGRVFERLVEGMQPSGLSAFAITVCVLLAAALCASFLPARRASRLDPMKALRQD